MIINISKYSREIYLNLRNISKHNVIRNILNIIICIYKSLIIILSVCMYLPIYMYTQLLNQCTFKYILMLFINKCNI